MMSFITNQGMMGNYDEKKACNYKKCYDKKININMFNIDIKKCHAMVRRSHLK